MQINAYDEYGVPKSGNSGRFGFTGQLWIAEIDAYSYRNRIYNQKLGVFLQTDPIGLEGGGLNLYAYVGNSPTTWVDTWGLFPDSPDTGDPLGPLRGCPFSMHCDSEDLEAVIRDPMTRGWLFEADDRGLFPGSDRVSRFVGRILGRLWTLPNTLLGLTFGTTGNVVSWFRGVDPGISFEGGTINFLNNSFMRSAMTLGDVVIYGSGNSPSSCTVRGGSGCLQTLGWEEYQHVRQSYVLGPLYLPSHVLFGSTAFLVNRRAPNPWHGPANLLETGPHWYPARPWPWGG